MHGQTNTKILQDFKAYYHRTKYSAAPLYEHEISQKPCILNCFLRNVFYIRSRACGEPIIIAPPVYKRDKIAEPLKGFSWNMTLGNSNKIWHYITVLIKRLKGQSFARRPTRIHVRCRRVYLNIYRSETCMEQLCDGTLLHIPYE
jgi:hypothetical protein